MKEQDIQAALDALDSSVEGGAFCVHFPQEYQTIRAALTTLPDPIRVIELAEDGLRNAQATLRHYRLYDLDKVEQALSEIRKLKGE